MKTIEKLTDQEILKLTDSDIEMIVNFKKAEQGIKILSKPPEPIYHVVPEKDCDIFYINTLGDVVFEEVTELKNLIDTIKGYKSIGQKYYNDGVYNFTKNLKSRYSNSDWDSISSEKVYSEKLYKDAKESLNANGILRSQYDKSTKEYNDYVDKHNYIKQEILEKHNEIHSKYADLNKYCNLMKEDYMPLAEGKEAVAIKFLCKAYSLTLSQEEYVLANYNQN